MNIKKFVSKGLLTSTFSASLLFNNLYAGTHQAICAYYSGYSPCRVTISNTHIDLKVYEDLGKSSNLVVGTVSTLLLGPVGLLGFLVKKKSGTIDYAVSFKGDRGRTKTAFIRFKNMKAAAAMGEELPELLKNISSKAND